MIDPGFSKLAVPRSHALCGGVFVPRINVPTFSVDNNAFGRPPSNIGNICSGWELYILPGVCPVSMSPRVSRFFLLFLR